MQNSISGAEVTRLALIKAALLLFGERGYEGVSTREIADTAAANIGSIAYHFGGKPGLHRACAVHVMDRVRATVVPAYFGSSGALTPLAAEELLEALVEKFGRFVAASSEGRLLLTFVLREVMQPSDVFEIIYTDFFKPLHVRLCEIFAAATGLEAESEEVKLATFSLMGQAVYFRVGRPVALRRMGWNDISDTEADLLIAVLKRNLKGFLAEYRKG